jgi:hypothetical protein
MEINLQARKSNLFFVVKCQAKTTEIQACQSVGLRHHPKQRFACIHKIHQQFRTSVLQFADQCAAGEIAEARWFSRAAEHAEVCRSVRVSGYDLEADKESLSLS